MQKRWGRKISDYGFSEFIKILEYKAREIGSIVQKIDRYYPSSQICHVCGTKNPETKIMTKNYKNLKKILFFLRFFIFADEAAFSTYEVFELLTKRACGLISIKLMP